MNKICSASLIAIALTISATASQARPAQKAVDEVRSRMTPIRGQYMRLDRSSTKTCTTAFDGGENRFDRMYSNIGASGCRAQY